MTGSPPVLSTATSIKDTIAAIERADSGQAYLVSGDNTYTGAVFATDLRRLLLSGAHEASDVGAYPRRHTLSVTQEELRGRRLAAAIGDVRLAGGSHLPVITPAGTISTIAAVADLDSALDHSPAAAAGEGGKTVLVVGGAGYLGSVLTRALLAAGYRVRVLDNFLYGRHALDNVAPAERLHIVHGDMRDIHTCVQALDGADAVVLLAAVVGDPACSTRPSQTIETNVLAAQAIASACRLQNIARFVYASTCSVYGTGTGGDLGENAPLNPVSLYARTKIASEQAILAMADSYFCPTVLRMGTLYGYAPRMRFDLVVNTMTMKAFTERRIQVFGGQQWRPLLHVADAADAYTACLQTDLDVVGGQVFNTGSDAQNYQIRDLAGIVAGSVGGVDVEYDQSSLDTRDYRVSFTKIQTALGFRPHRSIETSAKDIYHRLAHGMIANPASKIYYNHYFDSTEE